MDRQRRIQIYNHQRMIERKIAELEKTNPAAQIKQEEGTKYEHLLFKTKTKILQAIKTKEEEEKMMEEETYKQGPQSPLYYKNHPDHICDLNLEDKKIYKN